MRLYTHPISVFPFRVKIALHEKGLVFEEVSTDLSSGASEAFLGLNPFAQIPVLEDDGFTLAESMAILEYLDEKYPEPSLRPESLEARATMRMLMCWSTDYWYAHWKGWLAPKLGERGDPWTQESLRDARRGLCTHLDVIEKQLGSQEWLAGEYSLADICYAPLILSLHRVGFDDEFEKRSELSRWIEQLSARNAVINALGL